jgi:hypothetical protein
LVFTLYILLSPIISTMTYTISKFLFRLAFLLDFIELKYP